MTIGHFLKLMPQLQSELVNVCKAKALLRCRLDIHSSSELGMHAIRRRLIRVLIPFFPVLGTRSLIQ